MGRFSIFLRAAWVGRSLFVLTSPSNSTVLSMSSRFFADSSECFGGDVSFESMCGLDGVSFSWVTASLAVVEGGSDEMAILLGLAEEDRVVPARLDLVRQWGSRL